MTVSELREILEEYDGHLEVQIAHQPSWPLCMEAASVKKKDGIIYICQSGYGGHTGYASKALFHSDDSIDLDKHPDYYEDEE